MLPQLLIQNLPNACNIIGNLTQVVPTQGVVVFESK